MIQFKNVSAVFVTRKMNQDLARIIASLPEFAAFVLYDNSVMPNRRVFGRFLAARWAPTDVVYVQDDDALVDPRPLLAAWQPGQLVANMPLDRRDFYSDGISLIGWGAVFEKSLAAAAFERYSKKYPEDELFDRECDRVFTALTPTVRIEAPFVQQPSAHASNRMCSEAQHLSDLAQIRGRIQELR